MSFTSTLKEKHYVIRLSGNLDLFSASKFKIAMRQFIEDMEKTSKKLPLVFDLSEVKYIDSPGIAALIDLKRFFDEKGIGHAYINITEGVEKVMQLTELINYLPIYSSETKALEDLLE